MTHAATLRLGELLIRAGLIDRQALDEALRRQAQSGSRLGEVLVSMGRLERDELPDLLSLQAGLRDGASEPEVSERLRIGRLLVQAGALDPAVLDEALSRSRRTGRKIGETLVEAGAISGAVLQRFLTRQRRLAAVAVAGIALAGALSGPAAAGDRARIDIRATVQTRALIERQRLPQAVTLSEQDVRRGYVDLEPVEIGIRTNHPAGVMLDLSPNAAELESVDVREAQGADVRPAVRAASVFVPQSGPGLRARTVWLKLRVKLAPGAAPGTIVHPFTVSLSPA
jgi:hypothetical protein